VAAVELELVPNVCLLWAGMAWGGGRGVMHAIAVAVAIAVVAVVVGSSSSSIWKPADLALVCEMAIYIPHIFRSPSDNYVSASLSTF
jgi:hypothetical protein